MVGELTDGEIVHVADLRRVGHFWRDVLLVWFVPAMGRHVAVRMGPRSDILVIVAVAAVVITQIVASLSPWMVLSGQRATATYKQSKCRFNHHNFLGSVKMRFLQVFEVCLFCKRATTAFEGNGY